MKNTYIDNPKGQDTITISVDDLCTVVTEAADLVNEKHLSGREALEAALLSHEKTLELRRARQEELEAAAVEDVEKHIPESDRGIVIHQTPRSVKLVRKLPNTHRVGFEGDILADEGML